MARILRRVRPACGLRERPREAGLVLLARHLDGAEPLQMGRGELGVEQAEARVPEVLDEPGAGVNPSSGLTMSAPPSVASPVTSSRS